MKIDSNYVFLAFTMLAFFAPLLLFGTSETFIFVVPFTVLIWFAARWQEIAKIERRSGLPEILLAVGLYVSNIVRNLLGFPGDFQNIGLFDMLVAFVAVCIAFYGLKGLKQFVLPLAYLSVLIVGYYLEFAITEVALLQNFLARLMTSILNALTIRASVNNNLVTMYSRQGNLYFLSVDVSCTGIKGMLAYGSLAVLMILDAKATFKQKSFWTIVGMVGTFSVNIVRLLSVFIAAYILEIDTALAMHTYIGYGLFVVWVLIFWTVALKYMTIPAKKSIT